MRRLVLAFAMLLALVLSLSGCGGSGESGPVTLRVPIQWGERTRDIIAPSSALTMVFVVRDAFPEREAPDSIFRAVRRDDPAPHQSVAVSEEAIRPGPYTVDVYCYSNESDSSLVASVRYRLFITTEGRLATREGEPVKGLTTISNIDRVTIETLTSGIPGQPVPVYSSAYDADFWLIPLSPGSMAIEKVSGPGPMTVNDRFEAGFTQPGEYSIRVRVDDKFSETVPLEILNVRTREIALDRVVASPNVGRVLAIQGSSRSLLELDAINGATVRRKVFSEEPISVASSSSSIFVSFRNSLKVVRLNPSDLSIQYEFQSVLPSDAFADSTTSVTGLAINPADPDLVALTHYTATFNSHNWPRFYRRGQLLDGSLEQSGAAVLVWVDATHCVFFSDGVPVWVDVATVGETSATYTLIPGIEGGTGYVKNGISAGGHIFLETGDMYSFPSFDNRILAERTGRGAIAMLPTGQALLLQDRFGHQLLHLFDTATGDVSRTRSIRLDEDGSEMFDIAPIGNIRYAILTPSKLILWTP